VLRRREAELNLPQGPVTKGSTPNQEYEPCHPPSPNPPDIAASSTAFFVEYDPSAGQASLFVYCPFGIVPSDNTEAALRRLLVLNIGVARDHNATYCIDSTTDEVAYYVRRDPTQVDAAWLRDELSALHIRPSSGWAIRPPMFRRDLIRITRKRRPHRGLLREQA
jgi:hypothetical protein